MPKQKQARSKKRQVPFVKGFHPPSDKHKQLAAMMPFETVETLPNEFHQDSTLFEGIPKCTSSDDWLAQYKEDGQTFHQFLLETPWLSCRKRKYMSLEINPNGRNLPEKYPGGTIYVLPLGNFSDVESIKDMCIPSIQAIIEYSNIFLGLPVKTLPGVSLNAENGHLTWLEEKDYGKRGKKLVATDVKSRFNKKTGRYQLCIGDILLKLRKRLPHDAICMIALTMDDLYEDETDLFVAGMAAGNHRVAIFSLLRYDPNLSFSHEFWYKIDKCSNCDEEERKRLVLQRSCKLVVHEINHLLGVDHCIFYGCCMNGAGHLEEDFRQPMFLCPVDLRKLNALCGFDIMVRYEQLRDFFNKHDMIEDRNWVHKRLAMLSK